MEDLGAYKYHLRKQEALDRRQAAGSLGRAPESSGLIGLVVLNLILLVLLLIGSYVLLVNILLPHVDDVHHALETVYPTSWVFSVENDSGAVATNYLITISATTVCVLAVLMLIRRAFLKPAARSAVLSWVGGGAITLVGVIVLECGFALLLGTAQFANRLATDQRDAHIFTVAGQAWWPWTFLVAGVALTTWRSAWRSVHRAREIRL